MGARGAEGTVDGLWSGGEAACARVHGANRLGANSLLDLVVFGKARRDGPEEKSMVEEMRADDGLQSVEFVDALLKAKGKKTKGALKTSEICELVYRAIQQFACVFRDGAGMRELEGIAQMAQGL